VAHEKLREEDWEVGEREGKGNGSGRKRGARIPRIQKEKINKINCACLFGELNFFFRF